jgi:predicted nucleic-acid-binding protein
VRLIADTNVLVRVLVQDDPVQAALAQAALADAEVIVIPLPVLCETCWVLKGSYGVDRAEIALSVRTLVASSKVVTDHGAVWSGVQLLEAGGDFADGVIAHTGAALGGETFLTFDAKAGKLLEAQGYTVNLLAPR